LKLSAPSVAGNPDGSGPGSEPIDVGEANLDERPNLLFQAVLACQRERVLVRLAHLLRGDALLQPVVTRDEKLLDLLADVTRHGSPLPLFTQFCSNQGAVSVKVLIADDHRLFAEALSAILSADERIEVVGLAASGDDAVVQAGRFEPDVVLMDISMPGLDGLEATREILDRRPDARVLMVTGSDAQEDVDAARGAGAAGYVTKDRIAAELVHAILEAVA
jgi:CheY-like chemotaxis protein